METTRTALIRPEDFSVAADHLGCQTLVCGDADCYWEADITDFPIGDRPHVKGNADLADLMEAARQHITDNH